MPQEKQKILNVPNVLTMIRMLLIPVYWHLFMNGNTYWALGVFALASLTDVADGFIARKYHLITDFGKLMDPMADKLMVISVMLSLALRGLAPRAALLIFLCKEIVMMLGGAVLYQKGIVVYALTIGKVAQATTVMGLLSCFFAEWFETHLGFPLHRVIIWCAVVLTLCALVFYASDAMKKYRAAGQGKDSEKSEAE